MKTGAYITPRGDEGKSKCGTTAIPRISKLSGKLPTAGRRHRSILPGVRAWP